MPRTTRPKRLRAVVGAVAVAGVFILLQVAPSTDGGSIAALGAQSGNWPIVVAFGEYNLTQTIALAYNYSAGIAGIPSLLQTERDVSHLFELTNSTQGFTSAVDEYGEHNFTYGLNGNRTTGITTATFGFMWSVNKTTQSFVNGTPINSSARFGYEEYWVGNLSTESVSGPYVEQNNSAISSLPALAPRHDILPSGSVSRPAVGGFPPVASHNWGGWGVYDNVSNGGPSQQIEEVTDEVNAVPVTPVSSSEYPTNVPSGLVMSQPPRGIDPVDSIWTGLYNATGSGIGLWQAGYAWDSINTGWHAIHPWYEFADVGASYNFSMSITNPGDVLSETLGNSSCALYCWFALVYDDSNGQYSSQVVDSRGQGFGPTWHFQPNEVALIAETETYSVDGPYGPGDTGATYQQLAPFDSVNFTNVVFWNTAGVLKTMRSSYQNRTGVVYQLTQANGASSADHRCIVMAQNPNCDLNTLVSYAPSGIGWIPWEMGNPGDAYIYYNTSQFDYNVVNCFAC